MLSEMEGSSLVSSSESEHQVKGRFLLDVVVGQGSSILQLLSSEDESLLIGRNALLVLDLLLDILNGVAGLHLQSDGLPSEGLDEDLHSSSKSENQMEGALLLDVVVGQSSSVLELLASEDESLLIGWDSFLVLDLLLHIVDGVRALNLEGDGLPSEGLDKDLHSSSQSKDQVKGALLLNVVVAEGSAILELLSSEDESLLVWGNSFLVLDLLLDVVDGVGRFDFQGDSLASEGLDEDLHSSSQSKDEVKGALLLDVVVAEGSSVLQLLASENQSLLVWGDSLLVLNLLLHILDGVAGFDFEGDGLSSEGFYKDLHGLLVAIWSQNGFQLLWASWEGLQLRVFS